MDASSRGQETVEIYLLLLACFVQLVNSSMVQVVGRTDSTSTHRQNTSCNYESRLVSSDDIINTAQLEDCEHYFFNRGRINNVYTLSEFWTIALRTKYHSSVYSDLFLHKFDSSDELRKSVNPDYIDQEQCLRHLTHLNKLLDEQYAKKYSSKNINFHMLLDTFGHKASGTFGGDATWLGAYDECIRFNIITDEGDVPTRYCLTDLVVRSWPKYQPLSEIFTFKGSVCLPRVCDSLDYKNKYDLISRLITFNYRKVDDDDIYMKSFYCLPDESSPLRNWWLAPKTALVLVSLMSWIALLVFCTIKYEKFKKTKKLADLELAQERPSFGMTSGLKVGDSSEESSNVIRDSAELSNLKSSPAQGQEDMYMSVYRSLSIISNLQSLFDTSKSSSMLDSGKKLNNASEVDEPERDQAKPIVDLRCVEGIKVICMSYVIMGHVLMCVTIAVKNGGHLGSSGQSAFRMTFLVPAFAVNAFFTITGILTTYLMFKQNKSISFMSSPTKWLAFIMYRYLRIMPMYVIMVMYTKYLAKYMSYGPLWDYGTSSLAQRRTCEEESWAHTLLFISNFKPPLDHCIPSAWYLANDFQFFIVTPIFLALLHKNSRLGRRLLKLCIVAGYLAGFWSIFVSDMEDMTPIARFMPHGFKTYTSHLSNNYTRPQYRIPSYLIGLLIGHVLHTFESDKLKYLAHKKKEKQEEADGQQRDDLEEPTWSKQFINYGVYQCVLFVLICCSTAAIGAHIPFNRFFARLAVAIVMPSYHIMFSLAVGLYILIATTGFGNATINAFLSHPFWKPLARLSLCAVLVNVEVINYFVQSKTQLIYLDNQTHMSLNLFCIVATYLAAIVLCVLFEAPVRAALNHVLSFAIKQAARQKKKAA